MWDFSELADAVERAFVWLLTICGALLFGAMGFGLWLAFHHGCLR